MKKIVFFMMLVLLISFSSAIDYKADIYDDKALIEINFGDVDDFEFKLPFDARVFETNAENYELINFEDHFLLRVDSTKDLQISYITNSVIDSTEKRNFFIFNNEFDEPLNIILSLPKGAVLGDLVIPNSDDITTDGKRIILQWNNFSEEEIIVDYNLVKEHNYFWFYLFIILLIAFVIFYFYKSRKFKKQVKIFKQKTKKRKKKTKEKRKKDITRNLFGEEKKIIEYLLNKKGHESWTKEIARDLEISKVRLSRRLRNLEQKRLIEKTPYGNENRIKLLKNK